MIYSSVALAQEDWPNEILPNFPAHSKNLACNHCNEMYLDLPALRQLQAARSILNAPIHLNSGHRCVLHNLRIGGKPHSTHKRLAFDVRAVGNPYTRFELLIALVKVGFSTFGLYNTFIHTDPRPQRLWYGKGAREIWKG